MPPSNNALFRNARRVAALSRRNVHICPTILLLEGITSTATPVTTINRIADTIGPFLETFCKSDCLDPVLRAYDCTNNNPMRNLTADLLCSQQENGTLCPVKVVQQLQRTSNSTTGTLGSLAPLCAADNTCSTSCQQSYIELRSKLGCCGANWYGTSSSPYSTYGNFFAVCNVTLGNPCTSLVGPTTSASQPPTTASQPSGAAGIYFNVLLVAAVFLLSMTMV